MIDWRIDKQSKVPLYVQLKDLAKYYVSTGAILANGRLPGVVELAKTLQINFETVRKAYKELEKEGLIQMRRGMGTFATGHAGGRTHGQVDPANDLGMQDLAHRLVKELLQTGVDLDRGRQLIDRAFEEVATRKFVVFSECNPLQVEEVTALLRDHLKLRVEGVLLRDLRQEVERVLPDGDLAVVITTGFHVNEARKMLSDLPVEIDFVVTNMSPETRREVERSAHSGRFGFICRDTESLAFYSDMLRSELGLASLDSCTVSETVEFDRMLRTVDVLLVSPPVFREVRKLAPERIAVYNVMDRVDPMSLQAIKERLFLR